MSWIARAVEAIVIVQLSLSYPLALAQPQKTARKLSASEQAKYFENFRAALFEYVASQVSILESVEDLDRYFLKRLKEQDRKDLLVSIGPLKAMPTASRDKGNLVLEFDQEKFEISWPDARKYEFTINGTSFNYNPKQELKPQLEKFFKDAKGSKYYSWFQVLPEAEADFGATALACALAILLGVVLAEPIKATYCAGVEAVGWTFLETEMCITLQKAQEERQFGDSPTLDAVANLAGHDDKNILARWEAEPQEKSCPSNNDGRPRAYENRIRTVEAKEGEKTAISGWFSVQAKFTAAGVPTDVIITRPNTELEKVDTTSRDANYQLEVHIAFDAKRKKPVSYRVPNPNYKKGASLLSSPTVSLNQTMKLSPEQKDMVAKAKDAVKFINYLANKCIVDRLVATQQMGIDPGSPTAPKADQPANPSTDVPPKATN